MTMTPLKVIVVTEKNKSKFDFYIETFVVLFF